MVSPLKGIQLVFSSGSYESIEDKIRSVDLRDVRGRLTGYINIGTIDEQNTLKFKLTDETIKQGFKIEVLTSGSNGYTRINEFGVDDTSGLSEDESDDLENGWSQYFSIETDLDEPKEEQRFEPLERAGEAVGTINLFKYIKK